VRAVRTIEVTRFGGPEVLRLRHRPDPVAGPGQVIVDVSAIPLLWLDTALRSGKGRDWFAVRPPYVPGNGVDGRTALGILDGISVQAGTAVLITGAAGGMGLLLIQLATARGARVVGAARGEAKLAAVHANGAVAAIDYSEPGWSDRVLVALGGQSPAVVLDGVGGEIGREAFAIIANGGVFSAHGAASGDFTPLDQDAARERGITVRGISDVQFTPEDGARRLRDVLAQAVAGHIAPVIGPTYPLADAAEAHRRIEARDVVGKSLLLVDQSHR
jgi:NADPH:quinone reductase